MARIKISHPDCYVFETQLPVRVTDLNYGNHVGNHQLLAFAHEARAAFLDHLGYGELDMEGVGLIMADAGIEYKAEIFYPETLTIRIGSSDFTKFGFDMIYEVVNSAGKTVAMIKTGMVCFDYSKRKIALLPEDAKSKLLEQS